MISDFSDLNHKKLLFAHLRKEISTGAFPKNIKEITKLILTKVKHVVLDADALTCFKGDLKSLYSLLDKNKIITTHIGEFDKIFPSINKN